MIKKQLAAIMLTAGIVGPAAWLTADARQPRPGGYILERDSEVMSEEPGTHNGGGMTVGYSFFRKAPDLKLVFRKRALKPGSAIGYHLQKEDEIYYVLSGRGEMTMDGKSFEVKAGDAVLTRPGTSHGLKQVGADDLVIIINYEQPPRPAANEASPPAHGLTARADTTSTKSTTSTKR